MSFFEHTYEQLFVEERMRKWFIRVLCCLASPMSVFPSAAKCHSPVQRAMGLSCVPGVWPQLLTSHCFLLCFKDTSGPI